MGERKSQKLGQIKSPIPLVIQSYLSTKLSDSVSSPDQPSTMNGVSHEKIQFLFRRAIKGILMILSFKPLFFAGYMIVFGDY